MKRSTDRILTTHVGSLARPHELLDTMKRRENGRPYDADLLDRQITEAVADRVRQQVESGIDIVTDGEMSKVSFLGYVKDRLGGFEVDMGPVADGAVVAEGGRRLPRVLRGVLQEVLVHGRRPLRRIICRGPISYVGQELLQTDIDNLKAATADRSTWPTCSCRRPGRAGSGATSTTRPTRSTSQPWPRRCARSTWRSSAAGFILQVDDPFLIDMLSDPTHGAGRARALGLGPRRGAQPRACAASRAEQIRHHTCYGLNHGPRMNDIPLLDVVPFMLAINAGAHSFEVANPRHYHEWRIWEDVEAARRQDPHPRPARPRHELRRAPGADRRLHRQVRRAGRAART